MHNKGLTDKDIEHLTNVLNVFFNKPSILNTEVYQYVRDNSLITVHPSVIKKIMLDNGFISKRLFVFVNENV